MIYLSLQVWPQIFSIARLPPSHSIPDWVFQSSFFSISKMADELSIVAEQKFVPLEFRQEPGWRAFRVVGTLDFGLTGILASLTSPLAKATISLFAVSTFDTDYLLVKSATFEKACECLRIAGHNLD